MQKIVTPPTIQEAYQKYASLCARQECCQQELAEKMQRKGMTEQAIASVLQQLMEEGFINEERFCQAFVHDKLQFSRWGKIRIQLELRRRHISMTYIQSALDAIDSDEYYQQLRSLLEDYLPTVKAKSSYELRCKMIRYAYSRGFEQQLASDIVEELLTT